MQAMSVLMHSDCAGAVFPFRKCSEHSWADGRIVSGEFVDVRFGTAVRNDSGLSDEGKKGLTRSSVLFVFTPQFFVLLHSSTSRFACPMLH